MRYQFDSIIQKNYKLRDNYYLLSNNIRSSLDIFYNHLRDYQYEINNSAQTIIDKVKSTMDKSVSKNIEYNVPYVDMLSKFKDNTKIFPILSNLFDIFQTMEDINLELDETSNSIINIIKNEENFGFIKLQRKKVLLSITKINITIEFDPSNYSDNIKIIPDICKNI